VAIRQTYPERKPLDLAERVARIGEPSMPAAYPGLRSAHPSCLLVDRGSLTALGDDQHATDAADRAKLVSPTTGMDIMCSGVPRLPREAGPGVPVLWSALRQRPDHYPSLLAAA